MSGKKMMFGGCAVVALLLPFAIIARNRQETSPLPRYLYFTGMEFQSRFDAQQPDAMFRDGRAMRPHIAGTVAREDMVTNMANPLKVARMGNYFGPTLASRALQERVLHGQLKNAKGTPRWIDTIPLHITGQFMRRGQRQFDIFCTPCHGYSGYGDGMVERVAGMLRVAGAKGVAGWVQPVSLVGKHARAMPAGKIYNVITRGARKMARYDSQIDVVDRWAIVAYVRALQKSQHSELKTLTPSRRAAFMEAVESAKSGPAGRGAR